MYILKCILALSILSVFVFIIPVILYFVTSSWFVFWSSLGSEIAGFMIGIGSGINAPGV